MRLFTRCSETNELITAATSTNVQILFQEPKKLAIHSLVATMRHGRTDTQCFMR